MSYVYKKFIIGSLVIASLIINLSQCFIYEGMKQTVIKYSSKDMIAALEKAKADPKNATQITPKIQTITLGAGISGIERRTKKVGVDKQNNPIILAFITAGDKDNNRGTIVCSDSYCGSGGFVEHAIEWAKQNFYVIAIDPLEAGLSSHNDPEAMDGIGGYEGYSYQQTAYLYHELLNKIGIPDNSAKQPITFVGSSFDAITGLVYAAQYKDDPSLSLSFYIGQNPQLSAVTTTNPCQLGGLTPEFASQLADFYEFDRCSVLCSLYGATNPPELPGNFTEVSCPEYGNKLLNLAVAYGAGTPPAVFRRQVVNTLAFDPAPLMKDITIPCLILTGGIYQNLINKQNLGMANYGMCFACNAGCADTNYVLPIPNSIYKTYDKAGILIHATRKKEFRKDVSRFIKRKSAKCDPYNGIEVDAKYPCATPCITS